MSDSYRYDCQDKVKLLGNFWCSLTLTERNASHEYITSHPEALHALALEDRVHVLMARVSGGSLEDSAELESRLAEQRDLYPRLYRISKEWYEREIVAKDKALKTADADA